MVKKVFITAGEESGDLLGARLMRSLKKLSKDPLEFYGVGGDNMKEEGLLSIFPMTDISLMGWVEIIPHIPKILKRLKKTIQNFEELIPDVLITIDSPGFNLRLASKLQEHRHFRKIPFIHYVAPSVWAYKPERAKKLAGLYDHVLCLLPFEPKHFTKEGMKATFVGHSIMEDNLDKGIAQRFMRENGVPSYAKVLTVMPGSREVEIKNMTPIFRKAVDILYDKFPELRVFLCSTPRFLTYNNTEAKKWKAPTKVIFGKQSKMDALAASDIALVKSGTVALEPSIAGTPCIVAHKVSNISAYMLKRMIQVSFVNLINLVENKAIIPELLQEECTPEKIAEQLEILLTNEIAANKQVSLAKQALQELAGEGIDTPSEKAAKAVLNSMIKEDDTKDKRRKP